MLPSPASDNCMSHADRDAGLLGNILEQHSARTPVAHQDDSFFSQFGVSVCDSSSTATATLGMSVGGVVSRRPQEDMRDRRVRIGANAGRIVAAVEAIQTERDRSICQAPCHTVSPFAAPLSPEAAVSAFIDTTSPDPAGAELRLMHGNRAILADAGPEPRLPIGRIRFPSGNRTSGGAVRGQEVADITPRSKEDGLASRTAQRNLARLILHRDDPPVSHGATPPAVTSSAGASCVNYTVRRRR